jgi:peptide deformylase
MPLEIVIYPAAALAKPAKRVHSADGIDLHKLSAEMAETMKEADGVGLAAPQVGLSIRFIVVRDVEQNQVRAFVNPKVVNAALDTEVRTEGCLSFPRQYANVERRTWVTVRYFDLDFQSHKERFNGFLARVLQHEIDHLNGILLVDRAVDGLREVEEEEVHEAQPTNDRGLTTEPGAR